MQHICSHFYLYPELQARPFTSMFITFYLDFNYSNPDHLFYICQGSVPSFVRVVSWIGHTQSAVVKGPKVGDISFLWKI